MNLAEIIYQKSLDLPEEKAAEVIDFIDFLKSRSKENKPSIQDKPSVLKPKEKNQKLLEMLSGIGHGPADLSGNYKEYLYHGWKEKHNID